MVGGPPPHLLRLICGMWEGGVKGLFDPKPFEPGQQAPLPMALRAWGAAMNARALALLSKPCHRRG